MAPWGDAKLFFCILFITCCCTVTLAQIPMDCCYETGMTEIKKLAVADYRHQTMGQGCPISAVIFLTRHGRKLCLTPGQPWIDGVIKHVDRVRKTCKQKNYKGPRCFGMKPSV